MPRFIMPRDSLVSEILPRDCGVDESSVIE
jgi:hypothetical protein